MAARLTAAGIPAVLAMTHSVLVPTTRSLFGEFYEQLARHRAIGQALDAARLHLHNHPEKYTVQRGPDRVPLRLYDWFVPSLYQSGADVPLLRAAKAGKQTAAPEVIAPRTNLPARPESGFFGRRRELWDIERGLAAKTRRITLTGFGGQGKTALALEAGRWLTRTGLFESSVFVDYSRVQSADAVAVAVSHISSVLGESLPDARSAGAVLRRTATLVILDNLESLAAEPLRELLGQHPDGERVEAHLIEQLDERLAAGRWDLGHGRELRKLGEPFERVVRCVPGTEAREQDAPVHVSALDPVVGMAEVGRAGGQ